MNQLYLYLALGAMALCSCAKVQQADEPVQDIPETIEFTALQYTFANASRPYRRAEICLREGSVPSIVVYLHGGSSKGTDNEKQMSEPGIESIAQYLQKKKIPAIFLVPQCPEKDSQGKIMDWIKMANALDYLIGTERESDVSNVYILGGSMGGTGTWNMLSTFPELFTAGMACAGNPKGCNAANVAKTPVYAVMGSADKIMKPDEVNLQDFLDSVSDAGGKYRFDTEEGWDHETTCKESYTESRLDWVFGASL